MKFSIYEVLWLLRHDKGGDIVAMKSALSTTPLGRRMFFISDGMLKISPCLKYHQPCESICLKSYAKTLTKSVHQIRKLRDSLSVQ